MTWDYVGVEMGISFQGVVDEQEYSLMSKDSPLHITPPTTFAGYNTDGSGMVFWSAPPLTYAAGAWALAQCGAMLPSDRGDALIFGDDALANA
jgi:hypothetical protein